MVSGAWSIGGGVVFYLDPATDSFISQSNLAVCVQEGGHGGSGGTWYQTGRLHWSKCVYVRVKKKTHPLGLCVTLAHVEGYYKEEG